MNGQDQSFGAVEVTEHLWIPMLDGIKLAARLWLPSSATRAPVPALFEYIPYRKTDIVRARDERNHPFFAAHGYACLRVDMRGSGDSEGQMDDMYTDLELADARDVIAWIAAQRWCSGRVGMFGTSWGGTAALQANVDAPDALKAVIAVCATHDRYEDDIHHMGGCLLTDSIEWGATLPVILGSPPTPNTGSDWKERWEERLENLTFPLEAWVREEARGAFWRHGSVIHQAKRLSRPILAIGGWSDRYSNSVMSLLSARPDLVWGVVGPWGHHYPDQGRPRPAIGFQQLALAWWDAWLKETALVPPDWPRLRVWLSEFDLPADQIERRNGRWVQSGPPKSHVRTEIWHLGDDGLSPTPSGAGDWAVPTDLRVGQASGDTGYFGRQGGEPLDQREDDALSLTFDTPPLTEDCILFGSAEAILQLQAHQQGQIALRLNDVAPDGTSARIVWTVRNLLLDEAYDCAVREDGTENREVRLSLPSKAYRLLKGHRLRLSLSSSYWPIIWPSACFGERRLEHFPIIRNQPAPPPDHPMRGYPVGGREGVRAGADRACSESALAAGMLRLPVFQGVPADLTHNFPKALDLPKEKRHHMLSSPSLQRFAHAEACGTLVTGWHQPFTELFLADTETSYGFETRATNRIASKDPSLAESTVEHRAIYQRPDGTAEVRCSVSVESDGAHYHLKGRLVSKWEGKSITERTWNSTIPRKIG